MVPQQLELLRDQFCGVKKDKPPPSNDVMHGPEHKFQDCMVDGDLWEFSGHTLNPTMEQVDLAIDDWGRMIQNTSDEDGHLGIMTFLRDPIGNNYQGALSFIVKPASTNNLNHHITMSFLDSEFVYVIKPDGFLDADLIRNLVVDFLEGNDLLQSISFQKTEREEVTKSEHHYYLCINQRNSKIPIDES
jgi:hypothetical protein